MFEGFPYTNFHELNLDWIIKIAKNFLDQYTHIQETISDGEAALDSKTQEDLQALETKKDDLEALLDAWYSTHSQDIADELAAAVLSLQNYSASTYSEFSGLIDTKAANTLESIPADYTELYYDVESMEVKLTRNIVYTTTYTNFGNGDVLPDANNIYRTSELLYAKKNSKLFLLASDTYAITWIVTIYGNDGSFVSRTPYPIAVNGANQIISINSDSYCRITFLLTSQAQMTTEVFNHVIELFKYVRFSDPKDKHTMTLLFNQDSELSDGLFNATTGVKTETTRWKYAIYNCGAGDKFVYTGKSVSPASIALFYNRNNDLIGNAGVSPIAMTFYWNTLIEIPDQCVRVMFCWFFGDGYPECSVYKYDTTISKVFSNEADLLNLIGFNRYRNLKIDINGDSLGTASSGKWAEYITNHLDSSFTNVSAGGAKMTGDVNSTSKIAELDADADIVLTIADANDWSNNIPIGSLETIDDPTTFAGAVQLYIQRVMARCANARIICMGGTYVNFKNRFDVEPTIGEKNDLGLRITDYNDMFRKVCKYNSIEFINLYELVGINRYNYQTYLEQDIHEYGYGYIHPNATGGKKYLDAILRYLFYNKNS